MVSKFTPAHSLPPPFPKDYSQEAGKWIDLEKKKNPPQNPGGLHTAGVFISKDIKRKIKYRRVSVERRTHVPSEPKTPAD